jgi:branched-chain amino acid aminotransferase
MPVNFNTRILPDLPEAFLTMQRGLFYADGLFETIRVFDGRIPFLSRHNDRLFEGLRALSFDLPAEWSAPFFERQILAVSPPNARIRLTVWRSPGGRYRPEDNRPIFLITAEELAASRWEWVGTGISLGVCRDVRLPVDRFSGFKTLNAARYVAAALEARVQGWDDGLVLNAYERIAEATSSNLFWWDGPTLCTPPLSEGCVAGVMRALVLQLAATDGLDIQEKPAGPSDLEGADEIFLTNAIRGIVPVQTFAARRLDSARTKRLFDRIDMFSF